MTNPNPTASKSVTRFRSPEEEQRIVSQLTASLNEGDSYFVISKRWYTSWQKYIAQGAPRPGPIDNHDIIIDDTTSELRRFLVEDEDYVLVPQQVWKTLLEWYNVGPPIQMTLISLFLSDERDVHNVTEIRLSKQASIRELYVKVCCAQKRVSLEKARIWNYLNRRKVKLLDPLSNVSLEESGLLMDQDIHLEVDVSSAVPLETSGLVGLVNLGNTGYMNSTLQCLAHTPPIVDYFLRDNPLGMSDELAKAFGELVKELWSSGKKAVAPSVFKTTLDKATPQFRGHYLHDSHELLMCLLTRLQEVSDIVNVCQGQCKSTRVCPVCGNTTTTYDSFTCLSLPLPSTRTWSIHLLSCLEAYLAEQPQGPEWFCPECKEKRQANKKVDLLKLPEILVLHLKRFKRSKYFVKKTDTFVNFPVNDLDMSKYVENKNDDQSYLYELYAVSNHHIGTGGVRHYTAYVKLIDYNKWYHFNDSGVSLVNESMIKRKAAYILFYRRAGSETKAQPSEVTDDMDKSS